jgi:fimbrial chaperone protein
MLVALKRSVAVCVLGITGLVAMTAALAGPMLIGPTVLEINPRARVAVLFVTNRGDGPLELQTEVLNWTQSEAADQNTTSDEIVVSPAIATVPPGRQQVFRVALRRPLPPGSERAFRVVVTDDSQTYSPSGEGVNLGFRIAHSLPLFVQTVKESRPALQLEACSASIRQVCVRVRNEGTRHTVVRRVSFVRDDWSRELTPNAVLLAGSARSFAVPTTDAPNGGIQIKVEASGVTRTVSLAASP